MSPVYLDHNATTPLDEAVLEAMMPYLRQDFGNPSSRHQFGRGARQAVDDARERVAAAVGAHPSQVVFVSGGTEANNLAIKGIAAGLPVGRIAIGATEHPSVAKPAAELKTRGWDVRRLAAGADGGLGGAELEQIFRQPPVLVSVMLANNETGVLTDVAAVAELARAHGAWVHTDAVQALGKIPVDFGQLGVHAMSLSAHKIYGPKGVGALVLDKRVEVVPLITGGGHEKGLRAGTENAPAIVGFGAACERMVARLAETAELAALRQRLEDGVRGLGAVLFGEGAARLPNTSFFAFPGIEGETLLMALDRAGFAVASGSACSSGSVEPSPVLLAMGVETDLARGAVRVSLGRSNNGGQIDGFLASLGNELRRLRKLSAVVV